MASLTLSRTGVPIRLGDERRAHIVAGHPELSGMRLAVLRAVSTADRVVAATDGAAMAIRYVAPRKTLVVVYRELGTTDGFVITAFLTSRFPALERRVQLWPRTN